MARRKAARRAHSIGTFDQALTLHRQRRLDEAERIYDAILATEPQHGDALHLSGVLKYQRGQSAEALRLVAAALKVAPGSVDVLASYGVILDAIKRHEEALASFDRVLAMGRDDAGAHYNRGNALRGLGRHAEALASYDRALERAPGFADAHYNRGNTLMMLERHQEALASYEAALAAAPGRADILNNYGAALAKLERLDEALARFDQALAGDPDNSFILISRAGVLVKLERPAEALSIYDKVLARNPDHAEVLTGRGTALSMLGRPDESMASLDRALRIEPKIATAHINRGNALVALTRMDEALASYAAALAVEPEHPDAHFNAAITRLCLGDFREGWKQYEYRWKQTKNLPQRPNFPQPMWRGEKELHGKTIFLPAEQGMGDAIQFSRYASLVATLGARVLLGARRPLATLMASVPGVSEVIADGETVPDFDLYCSLLSLPLMFGTEVTTIPANIPYLRPPQERIEQWRERLPQRARLRVGLCWAGNSGYFNDRNRSIPLERFAAILSVSGLDFVSLQREVGEAQAAILRDRGVIQLGQEFKDFADTAAVVAMLDLVISVDTAVAHLAGALGKAVGVLIPFSPDFRWMLDRTDSPWYPTMRLFRQPAIGDWDTPLEQLRSELAALAAKRSATGSG